MKRKIVVFFVIVSFLASGILPGNSRAYTIEQIKNLPTKEDFVVAPGKTEMIINPGETSMKNVTVANEFSQQMKFSLEVEDFTASDKPDGFTKFLGEEKGPYSLKEYIKPEVNELVLQPGDRANIPVYITIPKDAQPGGLYGAVIFSYQTTDPLEQKHEDEVHGGIKIKARIASLFFITVPGDVKKEGLISDFKADKKIYQKSPVNFSWLYHNTGNIYNSPYGVIEIRNFYNAVVDQVSVPPYFVMPSSTRLMTKTWDRTAMLGRYKATLRLNLGYGNNIVEKTVVFWVLPWKVIVLILGGLFIILVIIRSIVIWFRKTYIKKDKKKEPENPKPPSEN